MKNTEMRVTEASPLNEEKQILSDKVDGNGGPFIGFRRFADNQVGYMLKGLQTLIQLPSNVLSPEHENTSSSDKSHGWTSRIQQRLKEKAHDQSENRQRAIEEAYMSSNENYDTQKGHDNGFTTTCLSSPMDLSVGLASLNAMEAEGELNSLQLYMPIRESFLSNLSYKNLSPIQDTSLFRKPSFTKFLLDSHIVPDYMSIVRADVGSQLISQVERDVVSTKLSLLPYLLHSSYSPLVLHNAMPVQSPGSLASHGDPLPYAAAFRDLLDISQGRQMQNLEDMALDQEIREISFSARGPSHHVRHIPVMDNHHHYHQASMTWLAEMHRIGLLWTRENVYYFQYNAISPKSPISPRSSTRDIPVEAKGDQVAHAGKEEEVSTTDKSCISGGNTEHDLYEELLSPWREVDSYMKDTVRSMGSEMRSVMQAFDRVFSHAPARSKDDGSPTHNGLRDTQPQSNFLVDALEAGFGILQQMTEMLNQSSTSTIPQEPPELKTSSLSNKSPIWHNSVQEQMSQDGSWKIVTHHNLSSDYRHLSPSKTITTTAKHNADGTATWTRREEGHATDGSIKITEVSESVAGESLEKLYLDTKRLARSCFGPHQHDNEKIRDIKHSTSSYYDEACLEGSGDDGQESEAWEAYGRMIKANIEAREEAERVERYESMYRQKGAANVKAEDRQVQIGNHQQKPSSSGRGWFWA